MRLALQAHHDQLQEYLSRWGKKQQEILDSSGSLKDTLRLESADEKPCIHQAQDTSWATTLVPVCPPCEEKSSEQASHTKSDANGQLERVTAVPICLPSDTSASDVVFPDIEMSRQCSGSRAPSVCTTSESRPAQNGGHDTEPQHQVGLESNAELPSQGHHEMLEHLEKAFDHLRSLGSLQADNPNASNHEGVHASMGDVHAALEHTLGQLKATVVSGCHVAIQDIEAPFWGKRAQTGAETEELKPIGVLGDTQVIKEESRLLGVKNVRSKGALKVTHAPTFNGRMERLVQNTRFELLCAVVIALNAAVMGISANYDMDNLNGPKSKYLNNLEIVFFIFYAIELGLRAFVGGYTYFFGLEWRWNWFDIVLVLASLWDQIEALIEIGGDDNSAANISFLRILRLLKMVRLLRMFRLMRMFRELRLILNSILGCVRSLLWALVLLVIIAYMAGMCLLNGCTAYLQATKDIDPTTQRAIKEHWGGVGQAMNSLFVSCTGGTDWVPIADPLWEAGLFFWCLFLMYIVFFMFVILNTLTSLFLDSIMEHSGKDHAMVIQMELEKKDEYISNLQEFFDEIDDDGNGTVSFDEFCRHANDPKLHAFAASLDIDVTDAKQFFSILSNDGASLVDIETFVVGCIKLKGNAKSTDLMAMFQVLKSTRKAVDNIAKRLQSDLSQSHLTVRASVNRLPGPPPRPEKDLTAGSNREAALNDSEAVWQSKLEL